MPARSLLAAALLVAMTAGCRPGDGSTAAGPTAEVSVLAAGLEATADGGMSVDDALLADPMGPGLYGDDLDAFLAARYEAYWEVFDDARRFPSASLLSDHASLDALATGEQLAASLDAVSALLDAGSALAEPAVPAIAGTDADTEHRVEVVSVDGAIARLAVCSVNDDVVIASANGAVLDDAVTTVSATATMVLTPAGWKLSTSRAVEISDGVDGCWLTPDATYPH